VGVRVGTVLWSDRLDARSGLQPSNFDQCVSSKGVRQRAAGNHLSRDVGFPAVNTGLNNSGETSRAPRIGWDVHGDGVSRPVLVLTGSPFEAGEYPHNINAGSPPFGNRSHPPHDPLVSWTPWSSLGRRIRIPIVTGPTCILPAAHSGDESRPSRPTRGTGTGRPAADGPERGWAGGAAGGGGSHSIGCGAYGSEPVVYLCLNPCVLNGVVYSVCSTTSEPGSRRVLSLRIPVKSAGIGPPPRASNLNLNSTSALQT